MHFLILIICAAVVLVVLITKRVVFIFIKDVIVDFIGFLYDFFIEDFFDNPARRVSIIICIFTFIVFIVNIGNADKKVSFYTSEEVISTTVMEFEEGGTVVGDPEKLKDIPYQPFPWGYPLLICGSIFILLVVLVKAKKIWIDSYKVVRCVIIFPILSVVIIVSTVQVATTEKTLPYDLSGAADAYIYVEFDKMIIPLAVNGVALPDPEKKIRKFSPIILDATEKNQIAISFTTDEYTTVSDVILNILNIFGLLFGVEGELYSSRQRGNAIIYIEPIEYYSEDYDSTEAKKYIIMVNTDVVDVGKRLKIELTIRDGQSKDKYLLLEGELPK